MCEGVCLRACVLVRVCARVRVIERKRERERERECQQQMRLEDVRCIREILTGSTSVSDAFAHHHN